VEAAETIGLFGENVIWSHSTAQFQSQSLLTPVRPTQPPSSN